MQNAVVLVEGVGGWLMKCCEVMGARCCVVNE